MFETQGRSLVKPEAQVEIGGVRAGATRSWKTQEGQARSVQAQEGMCSEPWESPH